MEKSRFDRARWVSAALAALAEEGHAAVRADRLAKRLKLTRGSFYWHFRDVAEFHDAVLAAWRRTALELVVARAARAGSPAAQLDVIVTTVFTSPVALERAVQSWAGVSPQAAKVYAAVGRERLKHLRALLIEAGAKEAAADGVASALYWAYLGYVQQPSLPGAVARVEAMRALARQR